MNGMHITLAGDDCLTEAAPIEDVFMASTLGLCEHCITTRRRSQSITMLTGYSIHHEQCDDCGRYSDLSICRT